MSPCLVITCRESTEPPGRADLVRAHFTERGMFPMYLQGVHGKTWGLDTRRWHHREAGARRSLLDGCRDVLAAGEAGATDEQLLDAVWNKVLKRVHDDAYRIDAGHVGLCLSHWMAWQVALQAGWRGVLIFEDDADLVPGFKEKYLNQAARLPEDADVWYVGCLNPDIGTPSGEGFRLLKPGQCPHGTHAMYIKSRALRVLIDKCVGAYTHVDQLIAERGLPSLRVYVSDPPLASQRSYDGKWPHAVGDY